MRIGLLIPPRLFCISGNKNDKWFKILFDFAYLNPKKNTGLFYLQSIFLIKLIQAPIPIFHQYILSNSVTTTILLGKVLLIKRKVQIQIISPVLFAHLILFVFAVACMMKQLTLYQSDLSRKKIKKINQPSWFEVLQHLEYKINLHGSSKKKN